MFESQVQCGFKWGYMNFMRCTSVAWETREQSFNSFAKFSDYLVETGKQVNREVAVKWNLLSLKYIRSIKEQEAVLTMASLKKNFALTKLREWSISRSLAKIRVIIMNLYFEPLHKVYINLTQLVCRLSFYRINLDCLPPNLIASHYRNSMRWLHRFLKLTCILHDPYS